MARQPKPGHLRMDTDLRIPVTSEQKALIAQATSDEPAGMAAWARTVLLQAAREKVGTPGRKKAGPNTKGRAEVVSGSRRERIAHVEGKGKAWKESGARPANA